MCLFACVLVCLCAGVLVCLCACVVFPELMVVDDTSYCLQAIVVHMGDALHSGHYVAFLRACCNAWVHLNDGDDPVQVS